MHRMIFASFNYLSYQGGFKEETDRGIVWSWLEGEGGVKGKHPEAGEIWAYVRNER